MTQRAPPLLRIVRLLVPDVRGLGVRGVRPREIVGDFGDRGGVAHNFICKLPYRKYVIIGYNR